ncbi:hypothetical protein PINS_up000393 [Pythium insidiosum]|nr:hypothetical protein PINS_up000393 [Pythium insidiosum]
MLGLTFGARPDPRIQNPGSHPEEGSLQASPKPRSSVQPLTSSPMSVKETAPFRPATAIHTNDSMWSRLLRHFTAQSPVLHRCLPKVKSGRLLLEVGERAEWKQFEVVLAGSSIGDLGLYYYATKGDAAPVGCIHLHSAHIDVLEEVVMVVTQEKTWFLCAEHGREASDWAETICATIEKSSQAVLLTGSARASQKRRRLSSNASAVTLKEIQTRDPKARVHEFLAIFVRSTAEDVRLQAMEGAFSWSCLRNVVWKVWLDVLPMDAPFQEWVPIITTKRLQYEAHRKQHALFHAFLQGKQDDESFLEACETSEDILLHNIFKDVRRTRGAMDFFRDGKLQCMLVRILYTYSNAHPEISYNQGMGELLATIVYLLYIEQWPSQQSMGKSLSGTSLSSKAWSPPSSSTSTGSMPTVASSSRLSQSSVSDDTDSEDASYVYVESFIDIQDDASFLDRDRFLRSMPFSGGNGKHLDCCREAVEEIVMELTSHLYLEHDAYLLLEEIMLRMAGAYCPELSSPGSSTSGSVRRVDSRGSALAMFAAEMASSPLYDQMNSIHHHVLSRCDPPTARHLSKLGVEPQMFVLRWVRVLMAREFEMAQVWQIWDAIFSLTPSDFSFINLLCVAAVREFREEILQVEDPTAVLLCLRDISDKVEADRLVDNARELYDALMIAAAVEATSDSA